MANHCVHFLKKLHRGKVLSATEFVRDPLARLAAVIEIEHRGNRIDAQPVDMKFLQPIQRIGREEIANLVACKVEDQRAPIGVLTLAWISVLVQRRTIELGKTPLVARKVRWHPIDDDANASGMHDLDELPELVGRAEPSGGRVVTADLIAPRSAVGMLGDGHQLDVREAKRVYMLGELMREIDVRRDARSPRCKMHFVHTQRRVWMIAARLHPLVVVPDMRARRSNHAGRRWRTLSLASHRIGLEHCGAGLADHRKLVAMPGRSARHDCNPQPAGAHRTHCRAVAPTVPVAGHIDLACVGRPHAKTHPCRTVEHMSTQQFPQSSMLTLVEQMQVDAAGPLIGGSEITNRGHEDRAYASGQATVVVRADLDALMGIPTTGRWRNRRPCRRARPGHGA